MKRGEYPDSTGDRSLVIMHWQTLTKRESPFVCCLAILLFLDDHTLSFFWQYLSGQFSSIHRTLQPGELDQQCHPRKRSLTFGEILEGRAGRSNLEF
jgi:hypothetical protein